MSIYYVIDKRTNEKILGFEQRLNAVEKVRELNNIYLRTEGIKPFDIHTIAS